MKPEIAWELWRTMEPYHAFIYFAPEVVQAFTDIGLDSRMMGYFASRAAPMGPVPPEVVIATFYNFNPVLVRKGIPEAWRRATPEKITATRFEGASIVLSKILGDTLDSPEVAEAAALAKEATTACTPEGRPLYAAHSALPWPEEPHLVLWQAQSLLREFRGDGHIAALLLEGVGGCEALIMHSALGEVSARALRATRSWSEEDWNAANERLKTRGWLDEAGAITPAGKAHRKWVEERTNLAALAPYAHLGEKNCERLRLLTRPLSKAIVNSGVYPLKSSFWDD